MTLLLLLLIIGIGALIRNKKISAVMLAIYLWVLFAFSTNNSDYASYVNQFFVYGRSLPSNIANIGYRLLCVLYYTRGLKYENLLMTEATVGLLILTFVSLKYSKNPFWSIVLYTIYPFIIDTTQVRTFFASSFIILGLAVYSANRRKSDYIFFAVCIIIASLIHVMCFALLALLLIPLFERMKWHQWLIVIFLIEGLIAINFTRLALLVTSESHVNSFMSKSTSIFSKVFMLVYFALMIAGVIWSSHRVHYELDKDACFADGIYKANMIMLIFLPLTLVTNDFLRLYRCITILDYILIINGTVETRREGGHDIHHFPIQYIVQLGAVCFSALSNYAFISFLYWDTVVQPLFMSNSLIKW